MSQETAAALIRSLKAAPFGTVPIAAGQGGAWHAIGADALEGDRVVPVLARWRGENLSGFPREERITLDGTRTWVRKQLVERPDRILFLLVDAAGQPVGQAGFANLDFVASVGEFDNIIKGDKAAAKGAMALSCSALIAWAHAGLGVKDLWVECFYDNFTAVALYHRLGFRPRQLKPIRRLREAECVRWVDAAPGESFERFHLVLAGA
jgi:RimJ/RimL family protein N-acetyltransferase